MAHIKKRKTTNGDRRYDVCYRDPGGRVRRKTFRVLKDATTFSRSIEVDVLQGRWIDPRAGKETLRAFSTRWLEQKQATLSPRTHGLYASQLRCHILPTLGDLPLVAIKPTVVRQWNADLLQADKPGDVTVSKVYRLLRTMLATAVTDELLFANPCVLKNAGKEVSPERPMPSVSEMMLLADQVPKTRRLLVLLGGQTGMRLGEILALRVRHIDELHKCIHVLESAIDIKGVTDGVKPPKSEAGIRALHIDSVLWQEVKSHLSDHVAADPEAQLFTGIKGGRLRRATWHKEWTAAKTALGLTKYHFHDLRHLAGTQYAQSGATTAETMRRLGHSTSDAALRYQHATDQRDKELAEKRAAQMRAELAAESAKGRILPRDGRAMDG